MSSKRLAKEIELVNKACESNPDLQGCAINASDQFKWDLMIAGPCLAGTPYDGGIFKLTMEYPSDFPFKPPTVKFETRIYHPNVNKDGTICLGLLKDEWAAKVKCEQIICALVTLMKCPDAGNALVPEIAELLQKDEKEYRKKARDYMKKYAR